MTPEQIAAEMWRLQAEMMAIAMEIAMAGELTPEQLSVYQQRLQQIRELLRPLVVSLSQVGGVQTPTLLTV